MEEYEANAMEKYYDINYSSQIALSHVSASALSASSPRSLFGLPELPIFKSVPMPQTSPQSKPEKTPQLKPDLSIKSLINSLPVPSPAPVTQAESDKDVPQPEESVK